MTTPDGLTVIWAGGEAHGEPTVMSARVLRDGVQLVLNTPRTDVTSKLISWTDMVQAFIAWDLHIFSGLNELEQPEVTRSMGTLGFALEMEQHAQ